MRTVLEAIIGRNGQVEVEGQFGLAEDKGEEYSLKEMIRASLWHS
jgi:hypothetical protein